MRIADLKRWDERFEAIVRVLRRVAKRGADLDDVAREIESIFDESERPKPLMGDA